MLVRIALLMLFAFLPWAGMSSAGPNVAVDEELAPPTECGSSKEQGPSLDDPNVDTDPGRPITEEASMPGEGMPGDDGGDYSDDDADGMCRSETLELWFQPEPNIFLQALAATSRALS